jgi:hypothetical protein
MSAASWKRSQWNARYPACVNCRASDKPRRLLGYCNRCSPFADKLRMIDRWIVGDSFSWKGCSYRGMPLGGVSNADYVDACRDLLRQELKMRRRIEDQCRGRQPIQGIELEQMLRTIGERLKISDRDRFHSWATMLDHTLSADAKRLMFRALTELWLLTPPRSSIWIRAYQNAAFRSGSRR